ncbi:hypothetical protein D3C81_615490 [compost metagenome]
MQIGSRCHHPIGIIQDALADDVGRCSRGDAALAVVQHASRHGQNARADMLDLAFAVRQHGRIDVQVFAVDGNAACCIVQPTGDDARVTRACLQDGALGVVQIAHVQIQLPRLQSTFRVVQGGARRHIQRARRCHDRLIRVDVTRCCRQADVRGAGLTACQVYAGACQGCLASR